MRYEVIGIPAVDINDVADDITAIYDMAARASGRIIAGHTLQCSIAEQDASAETKDPATAQYLFLVAEMPD